MSEKDTLPKEENKRLWEDFRAAIRAANDLSTYRHVNEHTKPLICLSATLFDRAKGLVGECCQFFSGAVVLHAVTPGEVHVFDRCPHCGARFVTEDH